MGSVDYAGLADRLGVTVEQVLEAASLGPDLRDLASDTVTIRIVFAAVDLERSRAGRATRESDSDYAADERYFERWFA